MADLRLLRICVVVEWLLIVAAIILTLLAERWLPAPLRSYVQADAESELTTKDLILLGPGLLLILAFVVSTIGLFVVWPPARRIYTTSIVIGLLLTPLLGPYIQFGRGANGQ